MMKVPTIVLILEVGDEDEEDQCAEEHVDEHLLVSDQEDDEGEEYHEHEHDTHYAERVHHIRA